MKTETHKSPAHQRYEKSPKGRETQRRSWAKYSITPKGIAARKRAATKWRQSAHGKADMLRRRLAVYGITPKDYGAMLDKQQGKCAICGTTTPRGHGNFHVDHCHTTGKVRGLLCHSCNVVLGHSKDDIRILSNAISYLLLT